jgi:hypothetical protein
MDALGRYLRGRARFVAALGLLVSLGCGGGGGGGGGGGLTAAFSGTGSSAAQDLVRMRAGSASGDLITIEVAIGGGQTGAADLYYFAFDLVMSDPAVAQYVPKSASMGDALALTGSQTGVVEASQVGSRIVLGVSKLGGGTGNRVTATEAVVVTLTLKALKSGVTTLTFAGSSSTSNPTQEPAAVDSTGAVISSVKFDAISGVSGTVTAR